MPDEVKASVDEHLTVFRMLFEQTVKARDGTHRWKEVLVDHEQPEKVVLQVRNRRDFSTLNQGDPLGRIREVSLFCLKVHESRAFRPDSYLGKRDINPNTS